jgi:hypothetical protein
MLKPHAKILIVVICLFMLGACAGGRTFHEMARAGDTVVVAAGRMKDFSKDNITVTITPSSGNPIIYQPNNPAVRAVVNLYPDPVSSLIVSMETQQDITPYALTYGDTLLSTIPYREKDWWTTSVFVDLPAILPAGETSIEISNPAGEYAYSLVEIVSGTGTPNTFYSSWGSLNANQLATMKRVPHFVVGFNGSTIPFAVQVDLSHGPDVDHGGTGRAYVINPRGDLKNVTWNDDGSNMRVILTPARGSALGNIKDFKYYVAGGVAGLQVMNVKAVDINGAPVTGVSASITLNE